jgi:3-oxoacyl-[acyl-carrier protein] reductase
VNRIDLEGRKAVVTGGAQGIGYAIAERLLESGAAVAIWDKDGQEAEAAAGRLAAKGEVKAVIADVTQSASVEAASSATAGAFGVIDILVNNAGISGPNKKTWEYTPEEWRQVISVDLTGVFLCCRAVVPLMRQNDYGRIVNIASIAGKEGNPNAPAYSAAKAGVIGLTKSLAKELALEKIHVNCVTPAVVKTAIFDQMSEEHIEYMLMKIPMARFGATGEIAALVAWLCSEECSFSTGAVFDLSGGRATY